MILESMTVGPYGENTYILGDEATGSGAIVDPGEEATRIALAVEQTDLEIGQIIITHAHIDHVGAVAALVDEYACPVLMHAEAEPMLQQLPTQAMMMGLRFGKVPAVDRHVADEEVLEVGDLRLRALYTPGHAPGHLAFYVEGEGVVLAGDALFAGSVGRTDLPGGNTEVLMQSINERLMTLPDETRVLSGHGPVTTIGEERAHQPVPARRTSLSESVHKHREAAPDAVRVSVLTISDTRTPENDTGGDTIEELMAGAGHEVVSRDIIKDDAARIRTELVNLLARSDVDAVITTGGTGISARDTTYEVVERMLEKRLDGFGEIFRMLSYEEIGAAAVLSRAVAGAVGTKLVACLPGSRNGVRLAVEKLLDSGDLAHRLRAQKA